MSSGNGQPRQYSLSMSKFQQGRLLELHHQQDSLGRGHRFLFAYREVIRRLERDPRIFGEHLFNLTTLNLEIRQAAIHPLVVDYGVHEEKNIVFIQGFKVLG